MSKYFCRFFILSSVLVLLANSAPVLGALERKPGGEIKTGKWVGYLKPEGSSDAIPLTMDSFLVKPDSVEEFPRLTLLFRLSLGGYQSSEYETEIFEDLQYDFDQGLLTLDEPKNEMVINAVVYSKPKAQMEGTVLNWGPRRTRGVAYGH